MSERHTRAAVGAVLAVSALALGGPAGAAVWPPSLASAERIAFVAGLDEDVELDPFTIRPDGTGRFRVFDEAYQQYGLRWSPDRTRLAYRAIAEGEPLVVINANGTNRRVLLPTVGSEPSWSPAGDRIAVRGLGGIYVVRADGTGARRITTEGTAPAWSPDGQLIAYSVGFGGPGGIAVVRPDGTGRRLLTNHPGAARPAWSPDGRTVAFLDQAFPAYGVLTVRRDGTGLRTVTDEVVRSDGVTWSPDGTRLAYESESTDDTTERAVVTIRPDGTGRRVLAPTAGNEGFDPPSWSPDGTRLAFGGGDLVAGPGAGDSEILVVNRDGTGLRQVTFNTIDDFNPVWSSR